MRYWRFPAQLVLCLSLAAGTVFASDELAESRDRLAMLQERIEKTLDDLQEKRSQAGDLAKELTDLKAEIRRVSRLAARSDQQIADLDQKVKKHREKLAHLKAQQRGSAEQLKKRLAVLYKTGDMGLFRILLATHETPQSLAEKYVFLSRMARHDRKLIEGYKQKATEQRRILSDLEKMHQEQLRLADRRRKEQELLQSAQKTNRRLLAAIRKDEKALAKMLDDLRTKAARLNELVKKLESEQGQPYTGKLSGLAGQKGFLPWPVSGEVKVGFGPRHNPDLGTMIESHGLEIASPVGSSVIAIAHGQVIYANRLKGYGNLIILDHGNKDYSLYAQVERFEKKVGDQITAGENIAFSGFEGRETIYFEIRRGGQPIDPMNWLQPR